jgi:hypothetical protein
MCAVCTHCVLTESGILSTMFKKELSEIFLINWPCSYITQYLNHEYKLIAFLKTLQRLKQEWQKSPALGPGKQMAKTVFGLEKYKEN